MKASAPCRRHDCFVFLEGGVTDALLAAAAGVIRVNSTVALAALCAGRGEDAENDVAGLMYPGDLVDFLAIRSRLTRSFQRLLACSGGLTRIRRGYRTRAAQDQAPPEFVARMESDCLPLCPGSMIPCARSRKFG